VLVTNGCINAEPAREVLQLTDAANIDLKCFNKDTYAQVLKGDLDTVKNFIEMACAVGVHVEVTTLLVPGISCATEATNRELELAAQFLAGLKVKPLDNVPPPWHLTAYYPAWNYREPATSRETVLAAVEKARKLLPWVHAGNI
jgi:pyruvate formate lyase activating enzyme